MRLLEVEMFPAGVKNAFLGRGCQFMCCGCGLSAGESRLLGGKGLGGGPDEKETLFFLLNGSFYAHKTAPHVVRIVTAGLTRRVKRFLQPSNLVAFKE